MGITALEAAVKQSLGTQSPHLEQLQQCCKAALESEHGEQNVKQRQQKLLPSRPAWAQVWWPVSQFDSVDKLQESVVEHSAVALDGASPSLESEETEEIFTEGARQQIEEEREHEDAIKHGFSQLDTCDDSDDEVDLGEMD